MGNLIEVNVGSGDENDKMYKDLAEKAFKDGKFNEVKKIIRNHQFQPKFYIEMQYLWYDVHYSEYAIANPNLQDRYKIEGGGACSGKRKFLIRQQNPPPVSISDEKKKKNKCKAQDRNALKVLYEKNIYPDQIDIEKLVRETDLTEYQVKTWFRNKRYVSRKIGKKLDGFISSNVPDLCEDPSSSNQENASQNCKNFTFENTQTKVKIIASSGVIKYREIFRIEVTKLLKNFYMTNKYPSEMERDQLSNQTKLTDKQIWDWFKNQRHQSKLKAKKLLKRSLSPNVSDLSKLPSSSIKQNPSQTPSTSTDIPTINQTKSGDNSSKNAGEPPEKHKRENVTVENNTSKNTFSNRKRQVTAFSGVRYENLFQSSNGTGQFFIGTQVSDAKCFSAFLRMINVLGIKYVPQVMLRMYQQNFGILKKLAIDPNVAGMSPVDEYQHYLSIWNYPYFCK